jgi:hypothetical protein
MDMHTHTESLLEALSHAATDNRTRGRQQPPHDLDSDSRMFPLLIQHRGRTIERNGTQFVFGSGPTLSTVHVRDMSRADTESMTPITLDIKKMFTNEAQKRAGIVADGWNPAAGFAANRASVRKVYDYYGSLYHIEPQALLWAGLARLGGLEIFYPGFLLLNSVQRLAAGETLPWLTRQPLVRWLLDALLPDADILFTLECRLLEIQKKIFDDLAWQHEVYLRGRLPWLQYCYDQENLPRPDYEAWQKISQADSPALIAEGNKALLRREQESVIQPLYHTLGRDLLWARLCFADCALLHPSTAFSALALAMHGTMESFPEAVPGGDILELEDRWRWMEHDVYPRWLHLHQTRHAAISARLQQELCESPVMALMSRLAIMVRECLDGQRLPAWGRSYG